MKIGMLTQWFDPETGPAALPGVYAREFTRQGHEVSVLTGFPNYPEGRLYPGYDMRLRTHQRVGDVETTRVALYPNHSRSASGRLVNYVSFGLSAASLGTHVLKGVDAIWVYNSPVTVALPMLTHSRMGRVPIFLHVQDVWPDSLVESGMFPTGRTGRVAAKLVSTVVRLMENRAAIIGVISPGVRDLILHRNPRLDASRIIYAPNPANEELFIPSSDLREAYGIVKSDTAPMEFMYAGAIGEVQGLDSLIEAAHLLRSRDDIRITLVGDGISRQRLEARSISLGLKNVHFMGRVPQEDIPSLMARADVQVVSLSDRPFLSYTTPSKIPSILASGLPILAQLSGDGASLVYASGAGYVVHPGNPQALADAMAEMVHLGRPAIGELGRRGREYYEAHLSRHAAAEKIVRSLGH